MFQDLPHPISSKMFMNQLINDTVPEARRTGKLQANDHLFFKKNDNLSYELDIYLPYQKSPNVTCIRCTTCHLLTRYHHKKFKQFSLLEPSGKDLFASNSFILLSKTWTLTLILLPKKGLNNFILWKCQPEILVILLHPLFYFFTRDRVFLWKSEYLYKIYILYTLSE